MLPATAVPPADWQVTTVLVVLAGGGAEGSVLPEPQAALPNHMTDQAPQGKENRRSRGFDS